MKTGYESPFGKRYAGKEMQYLFSDEKKFTTWRWLWIALAEGQKELGLPITEEQIADMKAYATDVNYDEAQKRESETRHDVMSHVHAFGLQAEKARPIIHLGATSCFVTDNADVIIMREALTLVKRKLVNVVANLAAFAEKHKALPTLGYTHFQPAQLTTVGKRACLWIQDLLMDLRDLETRLEGLKLRGAKGTTGTQQSFLALFDGNHEKVKRLDAMIAEKMGFGGIGGVFPVTGQTYPRKLDSQVLDVLSGVAQTASKFAGDIRLLQSLKEMEEPFEKEQIGSSAMAYKRNPMRSERMAALARLVICGGLNAGFTAAGQWFERTLDDSANRRVSIAEAFLATDGILDLFMNITDGLVVYPKVIAKRVAEELPFMATEPVLMACVIAGGDRQALHERIRGHAMEAAARVKDGEANDLLERIACDPFFGLSPEKLAEVTRPENFTGRAKEQTEEFLDEHVKPLLKKQVGLLGEKAELHV